MNNTQQHENLLRIIEELEDYAFLFLDIEGNVQTWNPGAQKIKGYSREEIIGQSFKCFYTEEDRLNNKPDNLLKSAITNGKAQDEGWRLRKNGTTFWGNICITAVHSEEGHVIGFGKLTRDLTEKKLAESAHELDIKNKEMEQFNYIASHDLQEPLRTVSNYIQILEEDYADQLTKEAKNHLQTIARATTRMNMLVRSLLDFSRLGKDKQLVTVDSRLLLDNVISDLSNLIKGNDAELSIGHLPTMIVYETEFRQLFQNLIINAIKFRKKDVTPRITIGCVDNKINYEFYISDNGIGIEPKHADRIFQIFQRLNSTHEFEGHGIGLANCKKIVEMHGGKIWVESEITKGCVFKFTILKYSL